MTTFFPDVSDFQDGLSLQGASAVIAKATEGTGWVGETYPGFKAQAAELGIPFLSYHFLRTGDVAEQVAHCQAVTGDVPLMLDVETGIDGTKPTLAETLDFIDRHGAVTLAYIPQWYWSSYWGSADLTGLTARGVGLISSHYTPYSDDGPGWEPYGGVTPSIWQYTSSQPFNGQHVDFNAFRGSVAQLRDLFEGGVADVTPDDIKAAVKAAAYELANEVNHPTTPTDRNYRNDVWAAQLAADGFPSTAGDTPTAGALKAQLDRIEAALAALAAGGSPGAGGPFTVSLTGGLSGSVSLSGTATPIAPAPPATGQ